MKENNDILRDRLKRFNSVSGPRVGDYVFIPSNDNRIPEYTRITHEWEDHVQTGGNSGSQYYLNSSGRMSYSGGLDPGIKTTDLILSSETKDGSFWFFDRDISGAGHGVYFNAPMRIFTVKEGANLKGIYSIQCPYYLMVLDQAGHEKTCNYWYLIQKHGSSHTAFTTEQELLDWLTQNRLLLSQELTPEGVASYQFLKYDQNEVTPK